MSSTSTLSVSSSVSASAGSACRCRQSAIHGASVGWPSWLGDRLTAMHRVRRPIARQRASCWQACSSTKWPMSSIRPALSASGMKTEGGTSPHAGWRQRASASKPISCRVSPATTGWYARRNWPRATASRRAVTRLRRSLASCCAPAEGSRTWLRPARLARWRASSALRSRLCRSMPCSGACARPMLAVTVNEGWVEYSAIGCPTARRISSAQRLSWSMSVSMKCTRKPSPP